MLHHLWGELPHPLLLTLLGLALLSFSIWLLKEHLPSAVIGLALVVLLLVSYLLPDLTAKPTSKPEASVFLITTQGCNKTMYGTGFAVGPHTILTAAHVVAGGTAFSVTGSKAMPAKLIGFDSNKDLALLQVTSTLIPLSLSTEPTTLVKLMGHPDGAAVLSTTPAKYVSEVNAQTADIYGAKIVTREVITLNGTVQRGDSGGPVVDPDNKVDGLVFALNANDSTLGYAVPSSVIESFLDVVGTSPIPSGSCITGSRTSTLQLQSDVVEAVESVTMK